MKGDKGESIYSGHDVCEESLTCAKSSRVPCSDLMTTSVSIPFMSDHVRNTDL